MTLTTEFNVEYRLLEYFPIWVSVNFMGYGWDAVITTIDSVLQYIFKIELVSFYDTLVHDDVIKWKHFPRYWPFVRRIHRSPVNSPHKGQWRGALMFSLICIWINSWVNNPEAGDLRRHRAHCYVSVMCWVYTYSKSRIDVNRCYIPKLKLFLWVPWSGADWVAFTYISECNFMV